MSQVIKIVDAVAASEGAGVRINRAIGTAALPRLDPFLMLDFFGSDNPGEYLAGFPNHPHRGFITLTYMLDGRMRHADSMGNEGVLNPGDVQWMKAASGVIHSEMPEQRDGLMRGFQLWLNLPAHEKMSDPEYRDIDAATIPVIDTPGTQALLIAGELNGVRGPVEDPHTSLFYADLRLAPGAGFAPPTTVGQSAFVFVYEGDLRIAGTPVVARQLATLGNPLPAFTAGDRGAALILVAGEPIGEPVAQYGPFVMNTEDEIRTAFADYERGRLVRRRAATHDT